MKKVFSIAMLCGLFFSCNDDLALVDKGPIGLKAFHDIEIGDQFKYVFLSGENYFDDNNLAFEYTTDTLVVEVEEITGEVYTIREYLTEGSAMKNGGDKYFSDEKINNGNEAIWTLRNDSLFVENIDEVYDGSMLTFQVGQLSLDVFQEAEIEVTGWKTDNDDDWSAIGYFIEDFELFNHTYEYLNVTIRNFPMAFDGDGNTIFYSRLDGIVRSINYSAWTGAGRGWDRIE